MRSHPSARKPVACRIPRLACEALERRRLFIAVAPLDVVSIAHGGAATGDEPSGYDYHYRPNTPPAAVSDDGRFVAFASTAHDLDPDEEHSDSIWYYLRDRAAGTTRRLGTAYNYAQESVEPPSISGDGRRVAFAALWVDTILDLNELFDVYVYDTQTGTTTLASAKPDGTPGGGAFATISRNGRYVAFTSAAGLDGGPAGGGGGLFRRDLQTGVTQRVDSPERPFHFGDYREPVKPDISDDGNVIAYRTPDGGGFGGVNIAVRDMAAGTIELASVGPDGAEAPDYSEDSPGQFDLAGGGRHVAFVTGADAVPQDVNFVRDVYVRDLLANTTVLASAAADGMTHHEGTYEYGATTPTISNDGRFVAFESDFVLTSLPDIDPPDAPYPDVYLRDIQTGITRVASTNLAGNTATGGLWPMLSADGRHLAFSVIWIEEFTGTPVPADGYQTSQVMVMNTLTGDRTLAGVLRPDGWAYALRAGLDEAPVLSRNGNVVVFTAEGALHQENDGPGAFPGIADWNSGMDLLAATLGPGGALDVLPPTPVVVPPLAVPASGATFYDFTVTWQDNVAMDPASVGNGDVVLVGPNGYRQPATLLSAAPAAGGTQVNATYRVVAPNGVFDAAANGAYLVEVIAGEVKDAAGHAVTAGPVPGGTLEVNIVAPDAPDLAAASLQGALPASIVAGAKQKVKPLQLTVTNSGTQPASGTVTVRLVASADGIADASDAVVVEVPNQKVKLAPGKSKVFRIKPGQFPSVPDGNYQLLAVIDAGGAMAERLESNNAAPAGAAVHIAAPFSDIGITAPSLSGKLAPGKKATLLVTARNEGNTAAKGVQSARVRLSADPANPAAVSRLIDVPLKLNLKPGATKALRAKLALPADLPAGTYYLVIELLPGAPWTDPDASDNTATSTATYPV